MRLELKNIELAEIYLNDELDAQDRKAFEKEITTNAELADTLTEVKLLRKAIARKELRAKINEIRPKGGFNTTFIIGLIGLVVILAVWVLWPTHPEISSNGDNSVFIIQSDEGGIHEFILGGKRLYAPPHIQKFNFKSEEGTTIVGRDGMLIIVPKNAFIDEAGKELNGNIELLLVEALGISEMVLYNLHTVSNGSVLESGGMFYTETTIDGNQVKINPKRPFYIEIPTPERDSDMMLFRSEVKPDGGINWVDPKPLMQFLVTVPLSELDFLPAGFADEVSLNIPFLGYDTISNTLIDSLYYSLEWDQRNNRSSKQFWKKVGYDREQVSEMFVDCGINPISIETIKGSNFQNSFIATRAFEERVRAMHKAQNGDALLQIYVRNLDKNLHICDALVADVARGKLKIVFEEFAKENLTNIKDAALYSDRLQAYYVQRSGELESMRTRNLNYYEERNWAKSRVRNLGKDDTLFYWSEFYNPSTVRRSSSNVFAGQWSSNGWGNIDKYMVPELVNNSKEVIFKIENESENADVSVWLGEINTYTTLNKNDGKYLARFPKQANEENSISHVFAIEQTPEGYSWGYKNFDSRLEEEVYFAMAPASINEIKNSLYNVEMSFGRLKNRMDQIVVEQARRYELQSIWRQKREAQRLEEAAMMEVYNEEIARQKEIAEVIYKLRNVAFPCEQNPISVKKNLNTRVRTLLFEPVD